MRTYFPTLTIAGSDCSGGAGIQADIKTMSAIGCYAMSVITSVTAQNTCGIRSVMPVTPSAVVDQIDMVMTDVTPLSTKIGILCNAEITSVVADKLAFYKPANIVVDPVMISTSGTTLLEKDAVDLLVEKIFPLAELVTPNQMEAKVLTGESDPVQQIKRLREMSCSNILITGGDTNNHDYKIDLLSIEGSDEIIELKADAVDTKNTHGTGCTLSSAIASYLALGKDLVDAARLGKLYVTHALEEGSWITFGHGHGPVNHFFSPRRLKNYNPNKINR